MVGGIVAALPSTFGGTEELALAGLSVVGLGKTIPSLLGQAGLAQGGPFPAGGKQGFWRPGPGYPDPYAAIGDGVLATLTIVGLLATGAGVGADSFLLLVGIGFSVKGIVGLAELWRLGSAFDKDPGGKEWADESGIGRAAGLGAGTTENTLLAALGGAAVLLVALHGSASTVPLALGLGAIGKALPSFVSAAIASYSPT